MQNKNIGTTSDMIVEKKTKICDKHKDKDAEYDSYPDISDIASATDCTGLMYAPPQNEEEFESYQELSGIELPKKKENE